MPVPPGPSDPECLAMVHRLDLVDVFGTRPFSGNPLAVVTDATDLDTDDMLAITRWLNLSETTFLLPPTRPEADYRVRIFTLSGELPFAGHPTLGTCHAWLTQNGRPRDPLGIVQECGAGLVEIRRGADGGLAFAAPPLLRSGAPTDAELDEALDLLGIGRGAVVDARWIDNGPGWLGVMLGSAEAVLALEPRRGHPRKIDVGVVGAHPKGAEAAFELRAFFSDHRGLIVEDPVTGSLNASVAGWLYDTGRASGPYRAAQGTRVGRDGRVDVDRDGRGRIWVGGATRTMVEGRTVFPLVSARANRAA